MRRMLRKKQIEEELKKAEQEYYNELYLRFLGCPTNQLKLANLEVVVGALTHVLEGNKA